MEWGYDRPGPEALEELVRYASRALEAGLALRAYAERAGGGPRLRVTLGRCEDGPLASYYEDGYSRFFAACLPPPGRPAPEGLLRQALNVLVGCEGAGCYGIAERRLPAEVVDSIQGLLGLYRGGVVRLCVEYGWGWLRVDGEVIGLD